MPIVLAVAAAAPVPVGTWFPYAMRWLGADGSEWDLAEGLVPMGRGVKGLHMPPMTITRSQTPLVHGSEITGYTIGDRPVYWPLTFPSRSREEWEASYGAFFRSLHPVTPGWWIVGEGASQRRLPLTYDDDGGAYVFEADPSVHSFTLLGVELVASRPLWQGEPVERVFDASGDVDFIPSAPGENYYPSSVWSTANASIENPGDEPAWLKWVLDGPHPSGMEVGVGGAVVEVPFAVPLGSQLVIDTDPAAQYATLDGEDQTAEMGFQVFAPVPPGGESALTIGGAGAGEVTASLTPLYLRAYA